MAANDRRKNGGGAQAPSPVDEPASKRAPAAHTIPDLPTGASVVAGKPSEPQRARVRIGDVVIYSHRRAIPDLDGKDYTDIPLMVTHVYNDQTIGGILFSESPMLCPNGAKRVDSVDRGTGGGTWRPRA